LRTFFDWRGKREREGGKGEGRGEGRGRRGGGEGRLVVDLGNKQLLFHTKSILFFFATKKKNSRRPPLVSRLTKGLVVYFWDSKEDILYDILI